MSTFSQKDDGFSLNDANIKIARELGIDLKAAAHFKYKFGERGLSGVALLSMDSKSSPFGTPSPTYVPTDPGKITDEGGVPVSTILEPEDSDGELVKDPSGKLVSPRRTVDDPAAAGVVFPDGSTNVTKRAASK